MIKKNSLNILCCNFLTINVEIKHTLWILFMFNDLHVHNEHAVAGVRSKYNMIIQTRKGHKIVRNN